ncbi:MAG: fibronectin type III domain-containing protein, partial [Bacteroidales bacterium]|nr:fibronectin type III domain-containing protein [Bacteroidales bacterium]
MKKLLLKFKCVAVFAILWFACGNIVQAQIPVRDYTALGAEGYYNFDCKSAQANQTNKNNGTAAWYANFENWYNTGSSGQYPAGRGIPPGWSFANGVHCYGSEGEFLRAEMNDGGSTSPSAKYIIMPALPTTTVWSQLRMRIITRSDAGKTYEVFVTNGSDASNITVLSGALQANAGQNLQSPDRGIWRNSDGGAITTFDIGTAYVNANATQSRIGVRPTAASNARIDLYQIELYYEGVSGLAVSGIGPYSANLSWTAFPGTSTYTIEVGPQGFTPGTGMETFSYTSTANSFELTGLSSSQNYTVAVQSDADQVGCWATYNFQTTITCVAPTALTTVSSTDEAINISWTGATNAQGYNI